MLVFNPSKREKASSLLHNRIFDPIRVSDLEKGAPKKIYLDVDYYNGFKLDFRGRLNTDE